MDIDCIIKVNVLPFKTESTTNTAIGSFWKPASSSSANHSIISSTAQSGPGLNVNEVPAGSPFPNLSPAELKKKSSPTVISVSTITKPSWGAWSGLVVFDMVNIKGSIGDFLITVVCR